MAHFSFRNLAAGAICAVCLTIQVSIEARAGEFTSYVNPLLGTATLWEPEDLGYVRTWKQRTWGAEVFPGSSLPNAMIQCTPATMYHSGAGYQYEDPTILGFGHTAKGHWGGLHVPLLPATGRFSADNYASAYSHENESAHPGYYQVFLERYHVNAELTSTLRCAFHRYTFRPEDDKLPLPRPSPTMNSSAMPTS